VSTKPFPLGILLGCTIVAAALSAALVEAEVVELSRHAVQTDVKAEDLRREAATPSTFTPEADAKREKLWEKADRKTREAATLRSDAASIRSRRAVLIAGITPVLALLLACFAPSVLDALRSWPQRRVAALGAGSALWLLLLTSRDWLTADAFDIYLPVILGTATVAAILSPQRESAGKLGAAGLTVWLLLWIPFDLRWYKDIWLGSPGLEYTCFGLLISLIAILGFVVVARLDVLGVRPPRLKDLKPALILCGAVAAIVIPLGIGSGFLEPTDSQFGLGGAVLGFLSLTLTVALPEELFFRGILDAGLQKHFRRRWVSLAISSFLFGLMHWNNVGSLEERLLYLLLASICGALYGLAFRSSRGLAAPVLLHTTVDLAWQAFLGG
jgi:membrane protease YdiL (CAAX protease family)